MIKQTHPSFGNNTYISPSNNAFTESGHAYKPFLVTCNLKGEYERVSLQTNKRAKP
jgi:hypothetical protein